MGAIGKHGPWALVGALGAAALAIVATSRGENINALWIVVAAVGESFWSTVQALTQRSIARRIRRRNEGGKGFIGIGLPCTNRRQGWRRGERVPRAGRGVEEAERGEMVSKIHALNH